MGKTLKKTDSIATATEKVTDFLFASFDHGLESEYFATVTEGIDRDRLRLYGVGSGQMTHDHDLESKESISCLSWGTMVTNAQQERIESSKKKQGKKTKTKVVKNKVVVLGTDVGSIWIYSVEQERIIKKLPGVTDSRLVDVILNTNGTHLYFLSHTGAIVAWSVEKDQPVSEWKTNLKHTHALAVNNDDSLLAVGGEGQIELWDIGKGQIIKTFKCQDKHSIQQLAFSQHGSTLVSSNGKKSIELWNTQHGSSKDKKISSKPTHSILVNNDDGVRHLDLTSTTPQDLTLLTVSDKGTVTVWKSQAAPGTIPAPTTTIKVMASKQDQIPVLWARLTRSNNNNKTGHAVVIARGSSARPLLETVKSF
ncbi:WD40-repeat-containing domain protein [Absidia repens]|uniref:WD40-repeat-containing domain protein n=1 Tax=Absidia repens TaxID=90262 RepID=A0A1X2INE2_9FUNG|nr:WD40-repeat-containing domain protein [Absidia repens]